MQFDQIQQLLPGLALLAAVTVIFWLVVIRPVKKSQQKHEDVIAGVVPGEKIITVGGIYGRVKAVREKSVELEIAPDVVVTLDRRAVRRSQDES